MWRKVLIRLATISVLPAATVSFDPAVLARVSSVRDKIASVPTPDQFEHPSSFKKANGKHRGFCNWIIPDHVMVGQYPGQNPEKDGPSEEQVRAHIEAMVKGEGITLFCSLQSEVPPQDDYKAWSKGDRKIYLEERLRRQFPNPFVRYAPIAKSVDRNCRFIHNPIEDLSVPRDSNSLNSLLLRLFEAMDQDENCRVYIHCWGGRGRAGLVGSCLLSLLWPELDADQVLNLVQQGYDSRAGAKDMPWGLKRSPQTETQRKFVRRFVQESRQAQNAT